MLNYDHSVLILLKQNTVKNHQSLISFAVENIGGLVSGPKMVEHFRRTELVRQRF